jgi:signal peptidase I
MSDDHKTSTGSDALPPEILKVAWELWGQTDETHYLPVEGRSMLPLLREGDRVLIAHSRSIRVGDIVVLQSMDELVTHRVLEIRNTNSGERVLLTKGDHVSSMDPPVPETKILGRVVAIRRGPKRMCLDTPAQFSIGHAIAALMRLQAELYRSASDKKTGVISYPAIIAEKSLSRILLWMGYFSVRVTQLVLSRWTE